MVNHPKEEGVYDNIIAFGNEQIKAFQEEQQLRNEVGMMHSARKTPTPNELIEEEIDAIERMKRDRVVTVNE